MLVSLSTKIGVDYYQPKKGHFFGPNGGAPVCEGGSRFYGAQAITPAASGHSSLLFRAWR
jgi:hypothetical protein